MPPPPDLDQGAEERVVLDSSVLLGANRRQVLAAADLHYYRGFTSIWIIAEFARVRTEWIAERAVRDRSRSSELRRRLQESRERINALVNLLASLLETVDYVGVTLSGPSWLPDLDDVPVFRTALAARAAILVTDNSRDFPPGQSRQRVLLLRSADFLARLYTQFPDAEEAIARYLGRESP